MNCQAVVLGGSAGALRALEAILPALPEGFAPPVLLVQHLHPRDDGAFARRLAGMTRLRVVEPCDKARIAPGHLYVAPANYHMLVEKGGTIGLSVDDKVNWSRPAIDLLFESAAQAWGVDLVAVILSGASADGAKGLRAVRAAGGRTIAQDPRTAESPFMPQAAIQTGAVDEVLSVADIARRLIAIGAGGARNTRGKK